MPVCDPFKQDFRQHLIQKFYENFEVLSGDTMFVGIGKPTSWISATGANIDYAPPKNLDCVRSDTDFWRTAFAFKKIEKEDVSIVIRRNDWQANVIYDTYRDTVDLYDDKNPAKFYVLVDEERVYKCIDNNYRAASTVAPTHTDSRIRTLADGYRWKYMYSISESKRKFLTKTQGTTIGFMPVEYVERVNENDDRELQYDVQSNAVDGSIDFVDLNQNLRNYAVSDRVLFFDSSNQVYSSATAGSSTATIGGSNLVLQNAYYNNMSINFESGPGAGQQRRITNYSVNPNSTANITLSSPLNYGISGGTSNPTRYTILPTISVLGDGYADYSPLNLSASTAEIKVSFLATSGVTGRRYLDRYELINSGKNYTYATTNIVAGLTFVAGTSGDIANLATVVLSPPGGHGSNAVKELGASSIMIVADLEQSEDSKITTKNDYRQFCLIKNPLLRQKQIRINLASAGLSGSFTVGATASQGATGYGGITGYDTASAKILKWTPGALGTTSTSELTLTNITGGTFKIGGIIGGVTSQYITRISEKTVAGTEYRQLKRLKLTPVQGTDFDPSANDFVINYIALAGGGNTSDNISASLSTGKIYDWNPELGTNTVGNLYLEDSNGDFKLNDYIYQMKPDYTGFTGPIGKIIEIDESYQADSTVYDQTISLNLSYNGSVVFDSDSFETDTVVSNDTESAAGYVVDWTAATGGTTGILRLLPSYGEFQVSETINYTINNDQTATISSIDSQPELKYRSGTVLHLQNLRPIDRLPEQKEQIKLIVEF